MIKQYFTQAWAQLRQQPMISAVSIAGTALAIFLIMLVVMMQQEKDIGIDLGTRNSLVFSTGKGIVLREPSVVVYDKDTEKIRAIGEEARQMASHLTSNMEVIWPIRRGVIVDYNVMEKMLKYFISQAMGRRAFRKPRVSISVPSGITEIERKAVEEAAYQSGAREVFLWMSPLLLLSGQV